MCDRRLWRVAAVGVALLCTGPPVRAQARNTGTERALLGRLISERAAAERRRRTADSLRAAAVAVDTVRVGTLTVLSAPGVPAALPGGVAAAWHALDARFGGQTRVLSSVVFVLGVTGAAPLVPRPPPDGRGVGIMAGADSAALAAALASAAAGAITERADDVLRSWLGAVISPSAQPPGRVAEAYVELATEPWTVVRRCHVGDLDGCRRMLGLVAGADYLDQWYDEEDRRRLLAALSGPAERWTPRHRACVAGGSPDACTALLRSGEGGITEPPVSSMVRVTLLDLALELGGAGAYDRLITTAGQPLVERLAAAATVSSDSLLRAWYGRVMAARPTAVTLEPGRAWVAFGWVGVLLAVALRSSRWR